MPITVVVRTAGTEQEFTLEDSAGIGRSVENDLVLEAPNISRKHARLLRTDGAFELTDLGSANGTVVNGQEIDPRSPVRLVPGSRFNIGPYELEVRGGTATPSPRPQANQAVGVAAGVGLETAVLAREPRLIIATKSGREEFPLRAQEILVGRAPTSDLVIDQDVVSRRHFSLQRVPGGYEIQDLGSRNGVRLGQEPITRHFLQDGDTLDIGGEVSIEYLDRPREMPGQAPQGAKIDATAGELIIGRAPACGIHLDHPTVSLRHARVLTTNGVRTIEDLGSTNGTYVNGQRVYPGHPLRINPGDEVRVGPVLLLLSGEAIEHRDESTHIALDAVSLRQQVNDRVNLLQEISFSIRPQEFVAVVGGSGAGKSTLLGALSGLWPATGGVILLNGTPLYENFPAFRAHLGYVPQDDILHKELPVQRALEYAAQLRLPDDTSAAERTARVEEVMKTLGLDHRRDVPIARLSGGQRKRVSIGAELLTKPGLFFLDEATSGLDPGTESQLMRLLRGLADDGHTIVLITHATKNVMLCDQVAFLARGGYLAYYGPPDKALEYFGVSDFDGIYERLEGESTPEQWAAEYARSGLWGEFVRDRLVGDGIEMVGTRATPPPSRPAPATLRSRSTSPVKQTLILSKRYFDIIRRDRVNLALMFLLAPLIGAIDLVAFKGNILTYQNGNPGDAMTTLFLAALFPFLVGALSSVREIVKEAPIYQRERTVSLGIVPYIGSKLLVAFLFALYHAAAMFAIKALHFEFRDPTALSMFQIYGTIVLAVMSGVVWGLVISALTSREEQAMMLAIGIIVVQVVFSGGMVSLGDIPVVGEQLGWVTNTHWTFRGLTTAAGLNLDGCSVGDLANCQLPGFGQFQPNSGEANLAFSSTEAKFGLIFGANVWVCWAATSTIMAVLTGVLWFLQKRKDTL
ncbi:MAG: FHA domain-containing protein [Dehalococcoidia bacterium]|nr:FHA domain-containing protein [Myxococcales bacterium]MCA9829050.1 FHA domain-containing protein [Dehalococcoidia bacterium]MCB9486247.1 FHA domain-containing protein [Thermoflexaceae bacterium]